MNKEILEAAKKFEDKAKSIIEEISAKYRKDYADINTDKYLEMSDLEFLQLVADDYNKSIGRLKKEEYDCQLCNNRGDFKKVVVNNGIPEIEASECKCKKIRRSFSQFKDEETKKAILNYNYNLYTTPEDYQKVFLQSAQNFINDHKEKWIIFSGQVGSGKSILGFSIANEFMFKSHEVYYLVWIDWIDEVKKYNFKMDIEEFNQWYSRYEQAEILYIDDLLKTDKEGNLKPIDVDFARKLLNYRYFRKLPTIISTEHSKEFLLELDQALGSRLNEMTENEKYWFHKKTDINANYRLKEKVEV